MTLTPEERESKLWRKLTDHWTERLVSLRLQNEGDKDATTTANLRGKISIIKECIALGKDLPEID